MKQENVRKVLLQHQVQRGLNLANNDCLFVITFKNCVNMSSFFFLISSSANRFCSIYRSLSSSVILASFFLPDFFFLGGIFGKKLRKFRSVNAKQDGVDQLLLLTTLPLVLYIFGSIPCTQAHLGH